MSDACVEEKGPAQTHHGSPGFVHCACVAAWNCGIPVPSCERGAGLLEQSWPLVLACRGWVRAPSVALLGGKSWPRLITASWVAIAPGSSPTRSSWLGGHRKITGNEVRVPVVAALAR